MLGCPSGACLCALAFSAPVSLQWNMAPSHAQVFRGSLLSTQLKTLFSVNELPLVWVPSPLRP